MIMLNILALPCLNVPTNASPFQSLLAGMMGLVSLISGTRCGKRQGVLHQESCLEVLRVDIKNLLCSLLPKTQTKFFYKIS